MASRNQILVSTSLYHIGVITLIAALGWIAISAYSLATKDTLLDIDPAILAPINPVLNKEVLSTIMTREKIEINVVTSPTDPPGGPLESDFVPELGLPPAVVEEVVVEDPAQDAPILEEPIEDESITEDSGAP